MRNALSGHCRSGKGEKVGLARRREKQPRGTKTKRPKATEEAEDYAAFRIEGKCVAFAAATETPTLLAPKLMRALKKRPMQPGSSTDPRATKLLMASLFRPARLRQAFAAAALAGLPILATATLAMGTATSLTACTSPTLPLPPPTLPTISTGTEPNTFHLKSDRGALPNALIVVVNRNESLPRDQRVEGTIADANGSWDLDIKATPGDYVDISQEDGNTRSPIITVQLK